MIYAVFLSALFFWPVSSTFVDGYDLPKALLLACIATVGMFSLLRRKDIRLPLFGPIAGYVLLIWISAVSAVNLVLTMESIGRDLTGMILFWWVVNRVSRDRVPKVVEFAVLVATIQAVGQIWGWRFSRDNTADGMIAMAVPLAVWFLYERQRGLWIIRSFFPIALILTLWQTERRTAFASLAIGLLMTFWSVLSRKGRSLATLATMVLLFCVVYLSSRPLEFEKHHRLAVWFDLLGLVSWIGHGKGNFAIVSYSLALYAGNVKSVWSAAHNDYFQILIEAGPLALAVWLWLLWSVVWRRPQTPLGIALGVSLWTVLIRACFHFPFQMVAEVAWFWVLAGLYWVETDAKKDSLVFIGGADPIYNFDGIALRGRNCL